MEGCRSEGGEHAGGGPEVMALRRWGSSSWIGWGRRWRQGKGDGSEETVAGSWEVGWRRARLPEMKEKMGVRLWETDGGEDDGGGSFVGDGRGSRGEGRRFGGGEEGLGCRRWWMAACRWWGRRGITRETEGRGCGRRRCRHWGDSGECTGTIYSAVAGGESIDRGRGVVDIQGEAGEDGGCEAWEEESLAGFGHGNGAVEDDGGFSDGEDGFEGVFDGFKISEILL